MIVWSPTTYLNGEAHDFALRSIPDDCHNAAFSANHALVTWTVTATYTAPGAAKGVAKPVSVTLMTMLTLCDDKIIEEDGYYDTAGLDAQTGTKTPPHVKPGK